MMKNIYALAVVAGIMSLGSVPDCEASSFFRPQPISQDLILQNALSSYDIWHKPYKGEKAADPCKVEWVEDKGGWVFAPKIFYLHDTGPKSLARYFFPGQKTNITVAQNNTSDVSSPWLKILSDPATPFEAIITTRPKCDTIGGAFTLRWDGGLPISAAQGFTHGQVSLYRSPMCATSLSFVRR